MSATMTEDVAGEAPLDDTAIIKRLSHIRDQIDETNRTMKSLKSERDEIVVEARDQRIRYSDIAEATGMSLSWINGVLIRMSGYRPRAGRARRRADSEE